MCSRCWLSYCLLSPVLCCVVSVMVAVRFNKLTVVVIVSLQVDLQWRRSRFQPTDPADWLPLELLKGRMHQFDGQHAGLVSDLTMTQLSV